MKTIIGTMSLQVLKAITAFAFVATVIDVNALSCFGMLHQPKLPKSADKLKR